MEARAGKRAWISSGRWWRTTCGRADGAGAWRRGSRRSPTATCTSATPRASGSTTASPQEFGGQFNLRFDDTNPAKEEQEYVDAIIEDVRWLGADWGDRLFFGSRLLRADVRVGRRADQEGQGLRLRPDRRPGPRVPRHADPARARTAPTATAPSRRTSTCSSGCARASSPTAPGRCGPRSTWPSPNLNMRDPVMYRILHDDAPPPGRQVVHLPDVRLGARLRGLHRGHHALALHAGVREPPPAVRLVHRRGQRGPHRRRLRPVGQEDPPPAADRVRPAEPDLHGDEQAQAARAGQGGLRARLGRPAHAHALRPAPARLYARGHPQLLQAHRRQQVRQHRRRQPCWSTACART